MPELPEVEIIKTQLAKLIVGKKIMAIETDTPKMLLPSPAEVTKAVAGAKITKIARRAKLIQIFLDNGSLLILHLKLTGRLLVRKNSDPKDDWQRITLSLSDGLELRFADLRKFGWLKLLSGEKELTKIFSEFGPEAMEMKTGELVEILSVSRRPIKIVLMDQAKISGLGNIYVNEALWLAGINPTKESKKLRTEEQKALYEAILKVLKAGLKYGGASDQFYLDAKGAKGHYQEHFLVYGRAGQICRRCKKTKIEKIKLGGRGTYWCPFCQV